MTQTLTPDEEITFLGQTDFRDTQVKFGIKLKDRRAPVYLLGKTGTGKSTLLETMIRQDITAGRGVALLDPHGDLIEKVLAHIPESRQSDVIYFNVPDQSAPLGFNPLEQIAPARRSLAAAGLLEVCKKLWSDSWGPRLEHILRNALLALFEQEGATLADVLKLLSQADFRKMVTSKLENEQVKEFWLREYEKYPPRFRLEAIAPIQNKVGAFLSDPLLNRILTQPRSAFKLRQVMDEGKILLVNLAKGKIGEDTSSLLGSLIMARLGLAALSRADIPEEERRDYYLFADEFHSYSTLSLATILSETRKFRLNLTLANQFIAQIAPEVREAILGNYGTLIAFRLGATDAELLASEFAPHFTASDLMSLPHHHVYLRLLIDGQVSEAFSAVTMRLED